MKEWIGRLHALWDGLAGRERILVGIAGGALVVMLLVFGLIMPVAAAADRAAEEAEDAEQRLVMMQRMRRDWDSLHSRLATVENRIQASREKPEPAHAAGIPGRSARA